MKKTIERPERLAADLSPHVGPTVLTLTSFTSTPAYSASAAATSCSGLVGSVVDAAR